MKNKKWLPVIACALAVSSVGALAACDDEQPAAPTQTPGIEYVPGGSTDTNHDVNYVYDGNDNLVEYSYVGKKYEINFLINDDSQSYVELSGQKLDDLKIVGFHGAIKKLSIKDIEDAITIDGGKISVTGIDEKAFYGCETLEEADLTKSSQALTFEVGEKAFSGCTSLNSVKFPDNIYASGNKINSYAFAGCEKLREITIPDKFSEIGDHAFQYCTALSSINLPADLALIDEGVFYMCDSLQGITGGAKLRSIRKNAFAGTGIQALDLSKFKQLVYIGDEAFRYTHFVDVIVPQTVTYIGNKAFYDIDELNSVNVPFLGNSVEYNPAMSKSYTDIFGTNAEKNTREVSVTIASATRLFDRAFADSEDVKSITVSAYTENGRYNIYKDDGVEFDRVEVEADKNIGDGAFADCRKLSSLSLPSGTAIIGDSAFYNCRTLAKFDLPETVTSIGSRAFYNCYALTKVALPAGLKTVGSEAFYGCRTITTISFPASLTSLGSGVLGDCRNLTSISIAALQGSKKVELEGSETAKEEFYSLIPQSDSGLSYLFSNNPEQSTTDKLVAKNVMPGNAMRMVYVPKALKTLNVSGVFSLPDYMFYDFKLVERVTLKMGDKTKLPESIREETVYSIGNYAYGNCLNLTAISIPTNIEKIGDFAFYGCRKLTEFTLPQSVTEPGTSMLGDCIGLTKITVEKMDRVTVGTNGLTEYTNYGSLNSWFSGSSDYYREYKGDPAECAVYRSDVADPTNMPNVYLPASLKTVIIQSVIEIPERAFEGWSQLTTATIGFMDNVPEENEGELHYKRNFKIKDYAFFGCSLLNTINCEKSALVKEVGAYAFAKCTKMTNSVLRKFTALETIGTRALAYSDCDESISLPASLKSIGEGLFYQCPNIPDLTIGDYDRSYQYGKEHESGYGGVLANLFGADSAGQNVYISVNGTFVPTSLTAITIGMVTELADFAFDGMSVLKTVTITTAVSGTVSLPTRSLTNMTNLKKLNFTIPKAYLRQNGLLAGNTALTSLTVELDANTESAYFGQLFTTSAVSNNDDIPGSLTGLTLVSDGKGVIPSNFLSGASLLSITFDGGKITAIGANAFLNCPAAKDEKFPVNKVSESGVETPVELHYYIINGWVVGGATDDGIYIPRNATGIAAGVVNSQPVYFGGTEAEWRKLLTNAANNTYNAVYIPNGNAWELLPAA